METEQLKSPALREQARSLAVREDGGGRRGPAAKLLRRTRSSMVKNVLRAAHLAERVVAGPLTPRVRTPSETVFMWEHVTLRRYAPEKSKRYGVPLVIVPPLMVRPSIFDLRPGHSTIHLLVDLGFDVFLVDFGVPEDKDKVINVDDYVVDFIPPAVEMVAETTGRPEVSLLGWSMGGIMSLCYAALFREKNLVKNLVMLGSPTDFSGMWPFNHLTKLARSPFFKLVDSMGNIPPSLTRNGFKLLSPWGTVNRYLRLLDMYWDREYVAGFESINNWVDEFIPYPGEAFKQFVGDFIRDDKLRVGQLPLAGRTVDLSLVDCSLLVVVGTEDKVAAPDSVRATAELVSSEDLAVVDVPVGHIGLVAGRGTERYVWPVLVEWLAARSR